MRKKKENIAINSDRTAPKSEALETEREERYEEIAGETSTEGLGPSYTTEARLEQSMEFADGPMAGESNAPPTKPVGQATVRRKRRIAHHHRTASRHEAAWSSKKF
jgi:hypothetical protein